MMVILGSAWSPVLDWRYTENNHQPPLHPRQLDGKEATPFNTKRLDQARVGLPGCGNHKTPFPVTGRRGTGPKGVKPFTEKGGLCLRLLLPGLGASPAQEGRLPGCVGTSAGFPASTW